MSSRDTAHRQSNTSSDEPRPRKPLFQEKSAMRTLITFGAAIISGLCAWYFTAKARRLIKRLRAQRDAFRVLVNDCTAQKSHDAHRAYLVGKYVFERGLHASKKLAECARGKQPVPDHGFCAFARLAWNLNSTSELHEAFVAIKRVGVSLPPIADSDWRFDVLGFFLGQRHVDDNLESIDDDLEWLMAYVEWLNGHPECVSGQVRGRNASDDFTWILSDEEKRRAGWP